MSSRKKFVCVVFAILCVLPSGYVLAQDPVAGAQREQINSGTATPTITVPDVHAGRVVITSQPHPEPGVDMDAMKKAQEELKKAQDEMRKAEETLRKSGINIQSFGGGGGGAIQIGGPGYGGGYGGFFDPISGKSIMNGMPGMPGRGVQVFASVPGGGWSWNWEHPDDPESKALREQEQKIEEDTKPILEIFYQTQDKNERANLKKQLQDKIVEQFNVRQQYRELEVKRLEKELARIKETIQKRNEKRDDIIKRRIGQLIHENEEDLEF